MTISITLSQAYQLAKEAIEERGPTYCHYDVCAYFDESGQPSCLVGLMLSKLGLTPLSVMGRNEAGIENLFNHGVVKADKPTRMFLVNLQANQDAEKCWEECLEMAIAVVHMHYPDEMAATMAEVESQLVEYVLAS